MKPTIIPLESTSRVIGNYDVKYSMKVPEWDIGKTALVYPPQDIVKYNLNLRTVGPMEIKDQWIHILYDMILNGVSRGNNKKYNVGDVVANLVVFEDEVEDYNQPDYDEV